MSVSDVHGPLGLQLLAGTRTLPYDRPDDHLLPPGRTRSQPIGESSQGPSCGRRAKSESALSDGPLPVPLLPSPLAADNAAPGQSPAPPSPVPTEIIAPELTQEEIVVDIQRSGIRVRDFAYESPIPLEQCPPELFDPILAWHVYESMLDNPNPARNPLNARHVRRLLDLGWVSQEADGHRWLKQDREALDRFDRRPRHPWRALRLTKPKKDDLREVATTRFQWVNADQLVPQFVQRGISRLAHTPFRGLRSAPTPRFQKRPANAAATPENEADAEVSPRLKKRRMSIDAESGTSTPPSPTHFPLTLINGKPPQQFPAGRPLDSPPRRSPPTAPPKQGTSLSRSLQRHLSMTSIPSSRSPDLSRSDSRTTLTQSTHHD